MMEIPYKIRSTLTDSLTARGIEQWWTGRNRSLEGARPNELWEFDPTAVINAAESFGRDFDYYV